jgi:ribosomal protein L11 methyltransferase
MSERTETWLELAVDIPADLGDAMASVLSEVAAGVEVRDAGTLIRAAAGRQVVVAHVAPEDRATALAAIEALLARAREGGLAVDDVTVRERAAHEDEWRDVWKQFFRATRVGRTFLVRPSWDPGDVGSGDRVIDLDPGRAFGTGGHASTRLVIRLAEDIADERAGRPETVPVARFCDLGCGSGILSIAAARLWPAAAGLALDIDPEATACAEENLARNHVASVSVITGGAEAFIESVRERGPFDVVLANIQADVLTEIARTIFDGVRPGGDVVLSGLLSTGADAVSAVYAAEGFQPVRRLDDDEWTGLAMRRR